MVVLTGARQSKTATFRRLFPNLREGMEILAVDSGRRRRMNENAFAPE